jgi:hypothetical protein
MRVDGQKPGESARAARVVAGVVGLCGLAAGSAVGLMIGPVLAVVGALVGAAAGWWAGLRAHGAVWARTAGYFEGLAEASRAQMERRDDSGEAAEPDRGDRRAA